MKYLFLSFLLFSTAVSAQNNYLQYYDLVNQAEEKFVINSDEEATSSGLMSDTSFVINVGAGSGGGTGGGGTGGPGCPPTSTSGARSNMGLYGGSSLDLTYNYSNKRLFAAISSPASLFYTDDTCKTWHRAFPDDSLEYGCGRGWGGRAVRVLSNTQNWVAVQTSQEAGTLNALVVSFDGGNTWRTAMDGSMMNSMGYTSQNVSGMALTDYYMFCLMGKYIIRINNSGPINPSTDITNIVTAIPSLASTASVKAMACGNNGNGYPYYIVVDTTGQFGSNPGVLIRYDGTSYNRVTLPGGVTGVTNVFTHPGQSTADTLFIVSQGMGGASMYRSLDGGLNWTQLTIPGMPGGFPLSDVDFSPNWISSMPSSNGIVLIVPGTALSSDMGTTWTTIGLQNNGGAMHPDDINTVVGTMGGGVVVSTSGAAGPYQHADNYGLEAVTIQKIARTAAKGVFYLATRAGLAYTTAYLDDAVAGYDKWNPPYGKFPIANVGDDAGISAVAIDPDDSLHVIAGYSNGFAVTTTGITGFGNVNPSGWGSTNPKVRDILFVTSSVVLATTGGDDQSASGKGNIWRSTDGGQTWNTVSPSGFTCGNTLAKGTIGTNTVIYCGTGLSGSMADPGTLWKSTDEGATWTQVNFGPHSLMNTAVAQLPIYDVAVDPRGTDTLYLACGSNLDYAFVKSEDGGSTYHYINARGEGAFTSVCVNQHYPDSVYTAIRRDILVYDASTDSAMYIYRGLPGELVPDLAFGSVLAGTSMGFFRVEATPLSTTGIKRTTQLSAGEVNIYPNPAQSDVTLEFNLAKSEKITVRIYDIVGHEVWKSEARSFDAGYQKMQLPSSQLMPGTYCVRINSEKGIMQKKFIRID